MLSDGYIFEMFYKKLEIIELYQLQVILRNLELKIAVNFASHINENSFLFIADLTNPE